MHQRFEQLGLSNPLPDHVHNAIMACLAKDPTQRPADAATFGPTHSSQHRTAPRAARVPARSRIRPRRAIEKTQRYLEKNLPQPVTSWWSAQSTGKQQFLAIASIVIGLMIAEMAYSKLANKGFLKTIRQHHPFLPWHVEPAKRGK